MRIITDFDGPIMDLSDRYYQIYQLCLAQVRQPDQLIQIMTKSEFWAYKRAKMPEQQIGILSGLTIAQAEIFKQLRDHTAHQLQYLPLDQVITGSITALAQIQAAGIDLVVMTLRRTCELELALNQHQLGQFFPLDRRYCLTNNYQKQGDINDKTQLMAQALSELPPDLDTWMIGDTETDIIAAQAHQIRVIGVLSGIRDLDQLTQHQPDQLVSNLTEAVALILEQSWQHHH